MSKTKYSSCRQVAKMLGVKYVRVWYVATSKGIIKPRRYFKTMLFTDQQVEVLRRFFLLPPEQQRQAGEELSELIGEVITPEQQERTDTLDRIFSQATTEEVKS